MQIEVKLIQTPKSYTRRWEAHYPNFVGKTIASFVSQSIDNDPDPTTATDITITFTDGTELRIEEAMQAGQIELSYNGE